MHAKQGLITSGKGLEMEAIELLHTGSLSFTSFRKMVTPREAKTTPPPSKRSTVMETELAVCMHNGLDSYNIIAKHYLQIKTHL